MKGYEFDVATISDKGLVKEKNQDNVLVKIGEHSDSEFGLFVVCDGLGGLSSGEVASLICINKFKRWWKEKVSQYIKFETLEIIESLKKVIYEVNEEIIQYSKSINNRVGTTVSAILILKKKYYIVHVGDSRIYKIKGTIKQLTEDHSYVAREVKRGRMTEEEARTSSKKNILLQCVGVKEYLDIYSDNNLIYGDEIFLLCSDGFYNKLSEKIIQNHINNWKYKRTSSLQKIAEELVEEVKSKGERDNISVIICAITSKNINKESKGSVFKRIFSI